VIHKSRRRSQEENNQELYIKDWMPPVTRSSTLVPGSIAIMATRSMLILVTEHIISICGFPDDLTMVEILKQEGWTKTAEIAMHTMQEADSFLSTMVSTRLNP
jgi:hypothetical protein